MILGPIQGHSYDQIASIVGTTEDVIKGRLHRARENIRAWLKEHR
jgi:DNA-directed RNA polymerase specialized sigma24 family protein